MELNPSQLRAVSHGSGPCLVLAGPGSGKTTVIIRRIQNLITQYHIRPENILAVTFSRAAAEEMSQRFSGADGVTFGTVLSIFLRILKEDLRRDLSVISENDSIAFMKMEIKKYSIPCRSADAMARELLLSVSRMKSGGAPSMHIPYETFMKVFSDYSAFLHERAFFDFDDIINECCRLLRSSPSVLAKWHERYKFILADEFQDLSPVQYMCIRLLAGPSGNIFAVGDDDQSIYGFRGAGSGIMRRFLSDFPAAVQILLDVNYRCASRILSASLDVIRENAGRFEKEFSPFRQGGLVNLRSYATRREEYREVIQNIRKLDLAGKDIAVLFRGNYDSYLFTQMLLREGCVSPAAIILTALPTDSPCGMCSAICAWRPLLIPALWLPRVMTSFISSTVPSGSLGGILCSWRLRTLRRALPPCSPITALSPQRWLMCGNCKMTFT